MSEGLKICLTGLSAVFIVMIILWVCITIVGKLFPKK
ncbi:MAG: OadG family protein [Planctomycetes bacterium]|nr:OadG family protein [Planctomycetota bacterium]